MKEDDGDGLRKVDDEIFNDGLKYDDRYNDERL